MRDDLPPVSSARRGNLRLTLVLVALGLLWLAFGALVFALRDDLEQAALAMTGGAALLVPLLALGFIWMTARRRDLDRIAELESLAERVADRAALSLFKLAEAERQLTDASAAFDRQARNAAGRGGSGLR